MFECVSKYIGRAWSCNSALADRQFDPSCAVPPSASVGMRAIARTGMAPPKRAVLSGLSMSGGGDRTGWLRRQDANFRIRSPWCWSRPETFFGKEAARQLYSRCALFDFSRPELRVLNEFDSEMQWFLPRQPSQFVSNASHMKVAKKGAEARPFADRTRSPCATASHVKVAQNRVLRQPKCRGARLCVR